MLTRMHLIREKHTQDFRTISSPSELEAMKRSLERPLGGKSIR
jgi:hypothetical protein